METESNKWKTAFFILLFIILAVIMAATTFLIGKNQGSPEEVEEQAFTIPTQPTSFPTATPVPTVDERAEIKQAIFIQTDLTSEEADITITDQREAHAKGNIKEHDAVSDAYWLAAKTAEGWVGVYDGQANPDCILIELHDFPSDLVPECLDEEGELIDR